MCTSHIIFAGWHELALKHHNDHCLNWLNTFILCALVPPLIDGNEHFDADDGTDD